MIRKSLSRQIFLYFLIVIIVSLSIAGAFTYIESSKAIDQQVEKYVAQIIKTALHQTEIYLARYEHVSNSILSETDIKMFLEMDLEDYYSHSVLSSKIKKLFQRTFIAYPEIHMMYVIGDHGKIVIEDDENLVSYPQMNVEERLRFINEISPANGEVAISKSGIIENGGNDVISLSRRIRGYTSYQPNGVLAIEVTTDDLASIWDVIDIGDEGFFFIVDKEENLIYRSDQVEVQFEYNEEFQGRILKKTENSFTEMIKDEPYLFVTRESDYVGWKLIIALPSKDLREPIETIRSTTVIVGLITLIFALLLAIRFGGSIVKPIRALVEGMRETEKGNWKQIQTSERTDEIGGLVHSYNLMVSRLSDMIEMLYEAELKNHRAAISIGRINLQRQQAEFEALQMQINPHFLYNTLETINCYAIVKDSQEITEIVEALSYMLRYSIQTNLEEITVANELNHVRYYTLILQHRIGREFEIDVAVPPSLLLEKMVRLTLQPLVENAFQHGFAEGIEDFHWIRIDAYIKGDRFYVSVEDNGKGIPLDKLHSIREKLNNTHMDTDINEQTPMSIAESYQDQKLISTQKSEGGIGVINVHRRIQMVFGNEYSLEIESELGQGTKMIMSMPAEVGRLNRSFRKKDKKEEND